MQKTKKEEKKMRTIKTTRKLATGLLGLGAINVAGTAMGSPLVGQLSQGIGSVLPATGSILGVGAVVESVGMLKPKKRKR